MFPFILEVNIVFIRWTSKFFQVNFSFTVNVNFFIVINVFIYWIKSEPRDEIIEHFLSILSELRFPTFLSNNFLVCKVWTNEDHWMNFCFPAVFTIVLFLYNELLRVYKKGVHTSQSVTKEKGAPNFEYLIIELHHGTKWIFFLRNNNN